MGQVIATFGVSHPPGIRAWPEAANPDQLASMEGGFGRLRQLIEQLVPDAIVLVAPEHWVNFSLANMPCFCVGLADSFDGPVEPWLKLSPTTVPGHPELARALVDTALADGVGRG